MKAATNNLPIPERAFYQILQAPTTQATVKAFKTILITKSKDWRQLITNYLNNVHHSEDEARTVRIVARARSYTLIDVILYKKGVVQPLLKCITQGEGRELLQEIYSGTCGHWSKGIVYEGYKVGILLAHAYQRCRTNC